MISIHVLHRRGTGVRRLAEVLTVGPVLRSHIGSMLIDVCQQRRVPDILDRSLKTGENGRIRETCENRIMLINLLNG